MQAVGSRRSLGASHAFPQQGRREKLETESADAPPDNHYKPQKDVGWGKSACGLLVSLLTGQFMLWNPSHKIKRQQSFLILYNGSIFGKHIVEHNFINQKGWAECNVIFHNISKQLVVKRRQKYHDTNVGLLWVFWYSLCLRRDSCELYSEN